MALFLSVCIDLVNVQKDWLAIRVELVLVITVYEILVIRIVEKVNLDVFRFHD